MNLIPTKYWTTFAILLLAISAGWIWLSRATSDETTQGKIPAPQKGFLAPDFSLTTTNGETIALSDLRGQAVLLNFWASWCTPCRAEMPAMERTFQEKKSQGYTVLAVNSTSQDNPNDAVNFASEQNLTFPILLDNQGAVSKLYQVRALPTSFFIDRQGVIQEVVVGGPMSEALLNIFADKISQVNE
jgi:cytochrome c biogenesis protein CcmG/thiol:disulfide interchange protein DsbE